VVAGTQKHRHCGILTSGTQNLTTAGSVVTLQFHSNDDDEDHDNDNDVGDAGDKMQSLSQGERQPQQPRRLSRTYKGFWLRFESMTTKSFYFCSLVNCLL